MAEFMSVIHLTEFGHVLGVVSAGSAEPTIEDLTGSESLGVRTEAGAVLAVPHELLSVTRVAFDHDVVDAPRNYRIVEGPPPVVRALDPENTLPGIADVVGAPGETWLAVLRSADDVEVQQPVLTAAGELNPTPDVPGSTARLAAGPNSALYVE